jgi:hypothetical protein
MEITLLNHACILIKVKNVRLLCDPWLFGTCFEKGWGLQFNNLGAIELAASCTHLWISHFHTDHFHVPTLKELVRLNPDIIALSNHSFNFKMDDVLRKIGFKDIILIAERKNVFLTQDIAVKRFPTTGSDNMLLLQSDEGVVLNYNDCNLPKRAREQLAQEIGSIDIFLNNFNHAGKLLDFPLPSVNEVKINLKNCFVSNFLSFSPNWVIPFASYHYYSAPESLQQNGSMLSVVELTELDPRIVPLKVGETFEFKKELLPRVFSTSSSVVQNPIEVKVREQSIQLQELQKAGDKFRRKLNRRFLWFTLLLGKLKIYITDFNRLAVFDLRSGLKLSSAIDQGFHIKVHSEALYKWFSKTYGTSDFVIGAHFDVADYNLQSLRFLFLLALLAENRLDLISLLKMLVTPAGLHFLFNRREEITALLRRGKFTPGEQR